MTKQTFYDRFLESFGPRDDQLWIDPKGGLVSDHPWISDLCLEASRRYDDREAKETAYFLRKIVDGMSSPLEAVMLPALLVAAVQEHPEGPRQSGLDVVIEAPEGGSRFQTIRRPNSGVITLRVRPQFKIDRYRIDFLLEAQKQSTDEFLWRDRDGRLQWPEDVVTGSGRVALECDGHDYHDRTKEQASKDRRRDRQLNASGLVTVRFTGSDIWADPKACADEAIDLVVARAVESFEQEVLRVETRVNAEVGRDVYAEQRALNGTHGTEGLISKWIREGLDHEEEFFRWHERGGLDGNKD